MNVCIQCSKLNLYPSHLKIRTLLLPLVLMRMLKLHPSAIASSFRVDENVGDSFCFD